MKNEMLLKMIFLQKTLFMILMGALFFGWSASSWAYPYLLDYKNTPQVLTSDKTYFVLKKMNQLTVSSFIITARYDEIQMVLPVDYQIRVAVNTKLEFPDVHEAENAPHVVHLLSGEVRLKSDLAKALSPAHVMKTAFFELPMPQQADAIVTVDMKEPSVTVKMIKGDWNLEFFAYEKKVKLLAGQMIKFKGQLADDQTSLRFDYLLDERKVPKGTLGSIEKFDVSGFINAEKQAEVEIEKKHKSLMRKKAEEAKKRKDYEDSFLCKTPLAQVNQCAWYIENKKCFRKRCNVSGKWGDVTERPMSAQCTAEFLVGACDY